MASPTFERKADAIADDLLEGVVSGGLAVGSILPKENELATHYHVARSVVREAIKLLEVHGLVRPTRRLGTVVLDPLASTSPQVVRALLVRGGRIDLEFFSGLLEVRAVLDMQMCELAAQRRTKADLATLDNALETMRAAATSSRHEAFNEATQEFAFALARSTHNPLFLVLARWHASIVRDLDYVFRTLRTAAVPHVAGAELVLTCIRNGDAKQTRELVATFHEWATPRLIATARLTNGEAPRAFETTPQKKTKKKEEHP